MPSTCDAVVLYVNDAIPFSAIMYESAKTDVAVIAILDRRQLNLRVARDYGHRERVISYRGTSAESRGLTAIRRSQVRAISTFC